MPSTSPLVLLGRAFLAGAIEPDCAVVVVDGRIAFAGHRADLTLPAEALVIDLGDGIVSPGFVDLHVHGYGGCMAEEDPVAMAQAIVRGGTTYFLPTVLTNDLSVMLAAAERVRDALGLVPGGATIGGLHLEGPYLNPRYGAQQAQFTLEPMAETDDRFIAAAGPSLKMMTIAPELPGSIETITRMVAAGVVVALGHTACSAGDYAAARRAGASHITHLFNAMQPPGVSAGDEYGGVRDIGIEELAVVDDGVTVDIVMDRECAHVGYELIEATLRCKPAGSVALISDAMAAGGQPPGSHGLPDGRVITTADDSDVARLQSGLLCGSTMSMSDAVRNAVEQFGVSPADSLRMATEVPARILGVSDAVGHLRPGARADLAVLNAALELRATLVGGELVHSNDLDQKELL